MLTRIILWTLNRKLKRDDTDPAELTGIRFLKNTVRFLMWTGVFVSIVFTVPQWRSVAVTMFAGAGLFVAIIGFAAQAALGNIISGIFIVIFKPFRAGDIIKAGSEHRGRVIDITLRHTVLQDFQNRRIIIPNSIISSTTVINDTIVDPKICSWEEIDVAYDADVERAIEVIQEESMKLAPDGKSTKRFVVFR